MNLDQLMSLAAGAGADRLAPDVAARAGVSEDDASAGIGALLPVLGAGLRQARQGGQLDSILSMASGSAEPNDAIQGAAPNLGAGIVEALFGGQAGADQIAEATAERSGLDAGLLQKILPVLATLLINRLPNSEGEAGLGGGAMGGLLGDALNALGGRSSSAPQGGAGLLAGLLDQDGDGDAADDILAMVMNRNR